MASVDVSKSGSLESAIRKFKRKMDRLANNKRSREVKTHLKKSDDRRRKHAAAIKRQQKRDFSHNEIFTNRTHDHGGEEY